MKIKIRDNNKIKNSNIGINNKINYESDNKIFAIIIEIIVGVIIAGIVFYLGWN